MKWIYGLFGCGFLCAALALPPRTQEKPALPTGAEVKDWLQKEPITEATWPAWRKRLTDWLGDTTRQTDPAYQQAQRLVGSHADASGRLLPPYDKDYLAWYFLGGYYLHRQPPKLEDFPLAESAYRTCLLLQPNFARAHRNLALALIVQVQPKPADPNRSGLPAFEPRLEEAERELKQAVRLEPDLPLSGIDGLLARRRGNFSQALALFEKALQKEPQESSHAVQIAECVLLDRGVKNPSQRIQALVSQFPRDGIVATYHALALAVENRPREARDELQRARSLGADPTIILSPPVVDQIEQAAQPGVTELFLKIMMWFGITYAAVMVLMAGVGLVLAMKTRGAGALDLLKKQSTEHLVSAGQIARAEGETVLARLYGLALMIGLILFYAAIPFIIVGLVGGSVLVLYLIFLMPRIPLRLILIVVIVGGFSAWAVFKSLFTQPAAGAFGILKSSAQIPRVHQLLAEVAQRVDTDPVDEVYLAPGAAIGVRQEGRGPFGMFGLNKRVLTLGFCTLRFLTVGELKAILAHEYAHFSHQDTFYSRFIYQVHMSIEEALYGMMDAGGIITYVNPFYWFLWLYYKSYSLLAAGYSRSREFLADRMAATLYGSAQFRSALEKVSTDGTLFEMTIYNHINSLLSEQKEYVNMYDAFAHYRNEQMTHEERAKLYQNLLAETGSVFASHPTFAERAEAIETLPPAAAPDDRPSLELFDQPAEIEAELTRFLTDYMAYIQILQAQAAEQAQ